MLARPPFGGRRPCAVPLAPWRGLGERPWFGALFFCALSAPHQARRSGSHPINKRELRASFENSRERQEQPGSEMRFCVHYHDCEKMGGLPIFDVREYDPFDDGEFEIRVSDKNDLIQEHVGSFVFRIAGIGKKPLAHYVWDCFEIDDVRPKGNSLIASGSGHMLNPPQRLDGSVFDALIKDCERFIEFTDISDQPYCKTLRRLANKYHRPNIRDHKTRQFCNELVDLIPENSDAYYIRANFSDDARWDKSPVEVAEDASDEPDHAEVVSTVPISDENNEVRRVQRLIVARQGQPQFRAELIAAYGGKCAVTGCDAQPALEAAHIRPHAGPASSVVINGLLLRADIHTLFDLGYLRVHPETLRITVADELRGTTYEQLENTPIAVPNDPKAHPDRECLRHRWELQNVGPTDE